MAELTKILHVEDEADIREIAQMALEMIGGFEVAQAEGGEAALELIEAFAPELILTDVQMPGMTGSETLAAIRALPGYETVPAIYMTAKVMESDREALVGAHDLGVITKPFDPTTLATEIREMWDAGAP
ncbi:response regulator [Antarcticimicrobium sediminis]|uniref:Response regulator n=1 Tax=Antarcticimicrobium sediminis TaxID=2546227 RepID=A0A4V2Z838_9RHOB|nr:response regulator [Antarcticimicrobium sediminis]TDE38866.1 response regulator [Antarcticimicrobium sediminis]